jgi:hypothetical protein
LYSEYIKGEKSKEDIRRYALDKLLDSLYKYYEYECRRYIELTIKEGFYKDKADEYYQRCITINHIKQCLLGATININNLVKEYEEMLKKYIPFEIVLTEGQLMFGDDSWNKAIIKSYEIKVSYRLF